MRCGDPARPQPPEACGSGNRKKISVKRSACSGKTSPGGSPEGGRRSSGRNTPPAKRRLGGEGGQASLWSFLTKCVTRSRWLCLLPGRRQIASPRPPRRIGAIVFRKRSACWSRYAGRSDRQRWRNSTDSPSTGWVDGRMRRANSLGWESIQVQSTNSPS